MTRKLLVAALPAESTAVAVMMLVPTENSEPEGGTLVTVQEPLTKSVAETAKVTAAPLTLVAITFMVLGTVMTGGMASVTVMLAGAELVDSAGPLTLLTT